VLLFAKYKELEATIRQNKLQMAELVRANQELDHSCRQAKQQHSSALKALQQLQQQSPCTLASHGYLLPSGRPFLQPNQDSSLRFLASSQQLRDSQ
jgi:hypothetical protein